MGDWTPSPQPPSHEKMLELKISQNLMKHISTNFLKEITWDSSAGLFGIKTTFPPIKTWYEGPILTNFSCLTTLHLWVEKILLVKMGPKRAWEVNPNYKICKTELPILSISQEFFSTKIPKSFQKGPFFGPFLLIKFFRPINAKLLGIKIWSI